MAKRLNDTQIGHVFSCLMIMGATGLLLLVVQAVAQPSWSAVWQYLFIGGFAAIVGSGVGGLLGLIFGLPQSGLAPPKATTTPPDPNATAASGDWYSDSSTLEKIAAAATTAIIALSLVNYDKIAERFDGAATAIGTAMQSAKGSALDSASARASAALAATKVARGASENASAYEERHKGALAELAVAQPALDRARADAEVPGGLLLGGYALLAFALCYLWTRRYLPAELANARYAQRKITRQDAVDTAELEKARANKLEQTAPKADTDTAAVADTIAKAQDTAIAPRSFAPEVPLVKPGAVQDDPWKGQFGGLSANNEAEIVASVRAVTGRTGQFFIALTIRGIDDAGRKALAGSMARLYLHPSFPDPVIRPVTFDPDGKVELTLVAYGAFTLGVQFLPGGDLLELDLAGLRDAPTAFRLN